MFHPSPYIPHMQAVTPNPLNYKPVHEHACRGRYVMLEG